MRRANHTRMSDENQIIVVKKYSFDLTTVAERLISCLLFRWEQRTGKAHIFYEDGDEQDFM